MEVDRNLVKIPRVMLDPARIEKLLSRRRVARAGRALLPEPAARPETLPISWQLSREHLEALTGEIDAAEPVLHNVYEDRDIFELRRRGLQQIMDLLQRMRGFVDRYPFSDKEKDVVRAEIDALSKGIEQVAAQTRFFNMPLLAPALKVAPLQPESARSAGNATDIVFVVSRAQSLRKDVRLLADHAPHFATDLANMGLNARLGLQTFGRTSQPAGSFRISAEDFMADLNSVSPGKEPQNALEALRNAVEDFSFREPCGKFVILLADADANDDFADARERTIEALKNARATLHVFSVNDPFTGAPFAAYEEIAHATGGQYFNIAVTDYRSALASLSAAICAQAVESGAPVVYSENRALPIGPEASETISVRFPDFRPGALGVDSLKLETRQDFMEACAVVDNALRTLSEDAGEKRLLSEFLDRILSHFDTVRLYRLDFKI
jgi:flagellin-like hook-associated protein FlgL